MAHGVVWKLLVFGAIGVEIAIIVFVYARAWLRSRGDNEHASEIQDRASKRVVAIGGAVTATVVLAGISEGFVLRYQLKVRGQRETPGVRFVYAEREWEIPDIAQVVEAEVSQSTGLFKWYHSHPINTSFLTVRYSEGGIIYEYRVRQDSEKDQVFWVDLRRIPLDNTFAPVKTIASDYLCDMFPVIVECIDQDDKGTCEAGTVR